MQKDKRNINHLDLFDMDKMFLTKKVEETPEGFLKGKDIVTNLGIFNYRMRDDEGKPILVRELRSPEEVFDAKSLESLKNIPITYGHPTYSITADNIEELQKKGIIIGFTGSNVDASGVAVAVDYTITNKKAIDLIKSGDQRAFSCGYSATIDFSEQGFAFGNNPFDAVQRDINYNHVALVPEGRAGDLAKITMGRNDMAILDYLQDDEQEDNNDIDDNFNQGKEKHMKKITLDGVEFEAEVEVIKALKRSQIELEDQNKVLDTQKKDISKLEAERDTFKEKADNLEKELNEAKGKNITDEEIQAKINERMSIFSNAKKADVEVKDTDANIDVKKKIILAISKNANLDGKDEVYIDARYDAAVETLEVIDQNKKKKTTLPTDPQKTQTKKNDKMYSSEDIQAQYIADFYSDRETN